MNLSETIQMIASNLGVGLTDLILIMTLFGGLVLFAKDYKIGLISLLVLFSIEFIIFAVLGLETLKVLLALFCVLIFMALSLYTKSGGGIN